ncbi:hypothetical protein TNCV_2277071 [Trichonephila clavipes]|nr:hypothetical protein TNCV_2277071 [Trichonephila clavipes]
MINAKKKERFLPGPGTIVLRQKDINLVTGKPFRIKTCCSSQMLINSLREDTEYRLDLGVNGMVQSNRTLPVVWLGRVNRYPYPRIKCIKYGNLNQVTRAEIYFFLRRESLVEKINAASWVTVLDLWKWYFRRSLLMNYPKHTTCVMPVGMYIIKKSRFKFLCAYDECNLTTRILRLLEPIEVPRMVDIDILMEIWKNRVKKIDFVLKWLSRVGSEVGPTKGFVVSPAGQGQERHPSLVPGFLLSTSWGVTSARGHGVNVYCLNSGSEVIQTGRNTHPCCTNSRSSRRTIPRSNFRPPAHFPSAYFTFAEEGFVNGILETGGVMDKCVQMWTRNYGALGQTARVCFGVLCANRKKEEVKRDFGDLQIRSEGRVVNTPLVFKRGFFQETRGDRRKKRTSKRGEKSSEKKRADRLRKRRGESQSFLLGDADQESETRMSKNALRTGRRQAVE